MDISFFLHGLVTMASQGVNLKRKSTDRSKAAGTINEKCKEEKMGNRFTRKQDTKVRYKYARLSFKCIPTVSVWLVLNIYKVSILGKSVFWSSHGAPGRSFNIPVGGFICHGVQTDLNGLMQLRIVARPFFPFREKCWQSWQPNTRSTTAKIYLSLAFIHCCSQSPWLILNKRLLFPLALLPENNSF